MKPTRVPDPAPPVFEGGPKGPTESDSPFKWVSWAFHCVRYRQMGDRFYDPWMGKHLKACQRIASLARDDLDEIKRRMGNLWTRSLESSFYRFTPECLLNRWDDLYKPAQEQEPEPEARTYGSCRFCNASITQTFLARYGICVECAEDDDKREQALQAARESRERHSHQGRAQA